MPPVIRRLAADDWERLKYIRLKALQTDPAVFGSTYAKESFLTDDEWRGWLTDSQQALFGLFDGDQIIGLIGIGINRNDPTGKSALLWASWIEPAYRRQGLSALLYRARLQWAADHPTCEKVIVSHRESNVASKYANQKYGFVFTRRFSKTWPDNVVEDEICYTLAVKPSFTISRSITLPQSP